MGQYYDAIIKKDKKYLIYTPRNFDNYSKLTEHSYLGNNFMAVIFNELQKSPGYLWWLGDYAETEDFKNKTLPIAVRERVNKGKAPKPENSDENWTWENGSYFVNYTKKEYLYIPPWTEKDDYTYNPVALLTAVGNGKGGGDYFGENKEYIGDWAGDLLQIYKLLPDDIFQSYADVGFKYVFPYKE